MSRPFSYNDENFTVIGNLLFCHIQIKQDITSGSSIIEIPPAIAKRMIYLTNLLLRVSVASGIRSTTQASVGVKLTDDKRYFLISSSNITLSTTNYLVGFYLLADI